MPDGQIRHHDWRLERGENHEFSGVRRKGETKNPRFKGKRGFIGFNERRALRNVRLGVIFKGKIMPRTASSMNEIYARLEQAGWKKSYVRATALPLWWKDEDAENPRLLARVERDIARFLGLDLEKLRAGEVVCAREIKPCYKKRSNTEVGASRTRTAPRMAPRMALGASIRLLPPKKRAVYARASNGTTPPSMAHGGAWPRSS